MEDERQLLETDDPLDRVRLATVYMDGHRAAIGRLATIRGETLRDLRASGYSALELAAQLGVTRQQIYRLLRGEH